MRVRSAEPRDRDRIEQILKATKRFTRQEIRWAMDLVDQALRERQKGEYRVWVVEDPEGGRNRRVEGYACHGPTPKAEGVFDLYWIAVDPRRQGEGLGRTLLQFVENEVRRENGRMLLIETSSKSSYAPTRRFYEKNGYREISRIKDFYRIEDDKIVFCKTF